MKIRKISIFQKFPKVRREIPDNSHNRFDPREHRVLRPEALKNNRRFPSSESDNPSPPPRNYSFVENISHGRAQELESRGVADKADMQSKPK